jgi:hypothetical protein
VLSRGPMVFRERFEWRHAALAVLGLLAVVALDWHRGNIADYRTEAAPAVNALARLDFHSAIAHQANMGPFSVILRAPLAALTHALGAGEAVTYRIGAIPCIAAGGLFGLALVRWFPKAENSSALIVLAVATPAAAEALRYGHPEEILGAAMSVGAVVASFRGKYFWAAVLLGCALATKQWALLAIGPAMLAAGRRNWWRVAAGPCAVAGLFVLPYAIANWQRFEAATREAASAPTIPLYQSWWYPRGHYLSYDLAQKTKPAIVLSAIPLTLLALSRRRAADSALPLLALLFLLRCTIDPQTQYYYHVPLLLTLLAWDVRVRRTLPWTNLATIAALIVTNNYLAADKGWHRASEFYFLWTVALAAYLLYAVLWPPGPVREESDAAPRPQPAATGHT